MKSTKKCLSQELKEAEIELAQVNEQLEERPDYGLGTGSTGVFTWEMALARRQRIEDHIASLREAMTRVETGSYGTCQCCGEVIDPERLEIIPTASECAECAHKMQPLQRA
ncbi:MAG: hypothetical protein GY759_20095 [Chloroflexi bacterium]|nr:hypothetical protein [Chloroflexota bacterium]